MFAAGGGGGGGGVKGGTGGQGGGDPQGTAGAGGGGGSSLSAGSVSFGALGSVVISWQPIIDLAIAKLASPSRIRQGQTSRFTVTVTNLGPSGSFYSDVTDWMPAGLRIDGVGPGCDVTDQKIECDVNPLNVGASQSFFVDVTGITVGSWTNVATIEDGTPLWIGFDPNLTNNRASATVDVVPRGGFVDYPNLFPQLIVGGGGVILVQQPTPMDVTVGNQGQGEAKNPVLTLSIPDGVSVSSLPPGCSGASTVTCDGSALLVGSAWPVDFTVTATRAGSYDIHGVLSSETPDLDPNDNSFDVTFDATSSSAGGANVALSHLRFARSIAQGGIDAISFVVSNAGPLATDGTKFAVTLPSGVSFSSVSSALPHRCATRGRVVTCSFASLSPGRSFAVTLDVTGVTAGLRTLGFLAAGRSSDPDSSDNAANVAIRIR
jgi:uncharacterized repeat protein (TIGR01451 family)